MAITAAQRSTALQAIVQAAAAGPEQLAVLLPGVTPGQVLTFLVNGLGTTADAYYTTALGNMVAGLEAQLAGFQSSAAAIQSEITADTII